MGAPRMDGTSLVSSRPTTCSLAPSAASVSPTPVASETIRSAPAADGPRVALLVGIATSAEVIVRTLPRDAVSVAPGDDAGSWAVVPPQAASSDAKAAASVIVTVHRGMKRLSSSGRGSVPIRRRHDVEPMSWLTNGCT